MANINDFKFTIEPEETIGMEHFVNSDNKEKEKEIGEEDIIKLINEFN